MGLPSHSYGTSLAIWDHTVLPATLYVTLVDCAHMIRPTIMFSSTYGSPMILVFWRQISSPYSNGVTFKFKVKYKWVR